MVVKTITVTEEAYNAFSRLKRPDESFSDVMKRVSKTTPTINEIAGALRGQIDFEHLRKRTREIRERISKSMEERRVRLRHIRTNRSS